MSVQTIVIAGAGQAGFQTAASLRQDGFEGRILLFGDEPGLPYQRPPLSKAYIKGGEAERLLFRNADFFGKNAIDYEPGVVLTAIDRTARSVSFADGRSVAYDLLVLALGTRNRLLPIEGFDLSGVMQLRGIADADAIRAALASARTIAVIGGGFIGLEIAATASAAGASVTVIEATHRLMSRVVSEPVSEHFLGVHGQLGVAVRLSSLARRILDDGSGRACGVELGDGSVVEAELVLVSAGVVPNAEIAEAAGLYVHDGIRVDDMLATEDPAISAIGDCASFPFGQDGTFVRLESVQNAVDQAKCLSRRLVGHPEPYRKVPWFWSDQGPHKLQMTGLTTGADHHVAKGSDGKLVVYCFRRGELIGVETVNAPAEHMASRKLLAQPEPVTLDALEAGGFDIAAMVRPVR